MRVPQRLVSAFLFILPFAVLLALWAVLVPYFNVNPRLFPHLGAVWEAGIEAIQDGTLPAHIGASLLRVLVGTALGLALAIPLGIAMGVSRVVSAFLTPLLRFFSLHRIPRATPGTPPIRSPRGSPWPHTPQGTSPTAHR